MVPFLQRLNPSKFKRARLVAQVEVDEGNAALEAAEQARAKRAARKKAGFIDQGVM